MRLWHKDLIPVLPRKQLLGQWRECCAIAKSIAEKGTPNHILVNKVTNYPTAHFYRYGRRVWVEMTRRGYKPNWYKFSQWFGTMSAEHAEDPIYETWHNDRYLSQCYHNLEEKFDCGGISDSEWLPIFVKCARLRGEI